MINALFVPPNPKELDNTTFSFFSTVFGIIFNNLEYSSPSLKLILGAMNEFFIIRIE